MYIFQKTYKEDENSPESDVVLILPHSSVHIAKFEKIAMRSINDASHGKRLSYTVLSGKSEDRTPDSNYNIIYRAKKVVIEATDGKANIYYMMGLAHALGKQVCVCYMEKGDTALEIPFNVHGRQSVQYSLVTLEEQEKLKSKLTEWLRA